MSRSEYLSRFTPSRTDPKVLEAIFVQREEMARDAEAKIVDGATSKNKYHLLYVGPRGSGKTHLVTLLNNRLEARKDLRDRLRIARLDEDETTTSYLKLLLRINRALHRGYPGEFPAIVPKAIPATDERGRVRVVERTLVERLAGRALLVIVENLDALLEGLKDTGQKQWRAFLQEQAVANTLATAQQLSPKISSRSAAFHGFFRTVHLEPLGLNEAIALLRNIAEKVTNRRDLVELLGTEVGQNRVRALDHLTGGCHRLYVMLSDFLTRDSLDDLVRPFDELIDELTPYYQDRLRSLPPQQREIVEHLARAETTVGVKAIADELMLTHQIVAAQLKKLAEKGYVRNDRRGRESLYELAEPMMRICVEVKETGRGPIRLLVEFLRRWFSKDELEAKFRALPPEAATDRLYVGLALHVSRGPEPRESSADTAPDLSLDELERQATTRPTAAAWLALGRAREKLSLREAALAAYDEALKLDADHADVWFERASVLGDLNRFEEALSSYDRALAVDPEDARALHSRGWALANLGRVEEALSSYDRALAVDPEDARAWHSRGVALANLGRVEEALSSCDRALAVDPEDAWAWHSRGVALGILGRWEEALSSCDRALAVDPEDAWAWHSRGVALGILGRWEEALSSCDRALAVDPEDARAWHSHGWALVNLGRYEEALSSYDRALAVDPEDATAWQSRGVALANLGRVEEALSSYDRALAVDPKDAAAWNNRGVALGKLDRREEATESLARAGEIVNAVYHRAEELYRRNLWDEGDDALRDAVRRFPPKHWNEVDEVPSLIRLIFDSSRDHKVWEVRAKKLVTIYRRGGGLAQVGKGLVQSLKRVPETILNAAGMAAWRQTWVAAGQGEEELKLPLRLFEVGMRYHETGDAGELLTLVSTERALVAKALGLDQDET